MTTPATPAPLPAEAVTAAMGVASTHADMERWRTAAEGTVGGLLARKQLLIEALEAAAPHLAAAFPRCPTPCDNDCEQACHEIHQTTSRQDHHPDDCVATLVARVTADAAHRALCWEQPADGRLIACDRMKGHKGGHSWEAADAVAAERERIASLANQWGATYAAANEPGHTSAPIGFLPFADLLRQGGGT